MVVGQGWAALGLGLPIPVPVEWPTTCFSHDNVACFQEHPCVENGICCKHFYNLTLPTPGTKDLEGKWQPDATA